MGWRASIARVAEILRMCDEYEEGFRELMKSFRHGDRDAHRRAHDNLKEISRIVDGHIEDVIREKFL